MLVTENNCNIEINGPGPCLEINKTQIDDLLFVTYKLTKVGIYQIQIKINNKFEYRNNNLKVKNGKLKESFTRVVLPYPIISYNDKAIVKV